jgi:ABC-2 type transport system ATP-binding protein
VDAEVVLEVEGLTKRFGAVVANDAVDLRVRGGQVVGLLGHNGAGKTTLVSQVVGLLRPDAGRITVAGVDAVAQPSQARRAVALQAQEQAPLDGLTPRAAIEFAARLRGRSPRDARAAAAAIAAELDIEEWLDRRALPSGRGVSGGVRRLTAFAMAAVAPTPLVVLDEPTNDVDASRRRLLWQAVRRLGERGTAVLLVTHNVVESERVVDDLVVLDRGEVVARGTPAQLHGAVDELRLELVLHPGGADPTHATQPATATAFGRPASLGQPAPTVLEPSSATVLEPGAAAPVPVTRRLRTGRRVLLTIAVEDAALAVAWARPTRSRASASLPPPSRTPTSP